MHDFATKERKQFINNVSVFRKYESRSVYVLAWLVSLVLGIPMPHEIRSTKVSTK